MEREALLRKLNWFYSLEVNQVEFYSRQSDDADNHYLSRALKKFAEIEQGHVENIREAIENLGETPTLIGEIIGKLSGNTAGVLVPLAGWEKTLEFNIAIENKAIEDYQALAQMIDKPELRELLLNNMLDEELHTAWMSDYLRKNNTHHDQQPRKDGSQ